MTPLIDTSRLVAWSAITLGLLTAIPAVSAASREIIVVATTSTLGAAARAVGGEGIVVETILPPGTCPSHFDLEPGQVRRVLASTLVLRHEFQSFLDDKLLANGVERARIAAVTAVGGLAMPETFARLCATVASQLAARVPSEAQHFQARAIAVARQAEVTGTAQRTRAARLQGRPVTAARHQEAFLSWLGLSVRTTLPVGDDLAPALVSRALEQSRTAGAAAVVGNQPSGRRLPAALSEALGVPLVMLENFPMANEPAAFWAMLERNVDALLAALPG